MLTYVDSTKMGRGRHGWLESHFHFSFANYYNPENIRFGVLRVVNDDIVQPGEGFGTHPHSDMEIISYVINGNLSHKDSMGSEQTITRGELQYMSAGTGITHSEYNNGSEELRFAQIWIFTDQQGYQPQYGDFRFRWEERIDKWLHMVTGVEKPVGNAPVHIHQDANIYASYLTAGKELSFEVGADRQAYLVLFEGSAEVNNIKLKERDALEIVKENVTIKAKEDAHMLILEMAYDDDK